MPTRGIIPHWRDWKAIGVVVVGFPLLGIVLGLGLPLVNRTKTTLADTTPALAPAPIDGARAYGYLKEICAIGPRPAGSAANAKQRQMVAQHFTKYGATVREQPFSGVDPLSGAKVDMVNLIGAWHPERKQRVVLGVHYDTRPFPDREDDPVRRKIRYIGANDGGSGVALLMEIAHHLKDLPTTWGVDLVLFDGEDLVYAENGEYCLGSKEFARVYAESLEARGAPRYVAAVVMDMIGDKNVAIQQEQYSLNFARSLVLEIWSVARRLKAGAFRSGVGPAVNDDHLPLNGANIPAIDLIDFRPPPTWHMSHDLPERCSAASLEQVGKVVTAWLALPRSKSR
jgi:glutaminyl-peptide cyclotransferase